MIRRARIGQNRRRPTRLLEGEEGWSATCRALNPSAASSRSSERETAASEVRVVPSASRKLCQTSRVTAGPGSAAIEIGAGARGSTSDDRRAHTGSYPPYPGDKCAAEWGRCAMSQCVCGVYLARGSSPRAPRGAIKGPRGSTACINKSRPSFRLIGPADR